MTEAKRAGADTATTKTYTPDTITLDCENEDFQIESGLWAGQNLYSLYKHAHLPWSWHEPLFRKLQLIR